MTMRIEGWNYKQSESHPEEVVFNEMGDDAYYHQNHAWDTLPTHRLLQATRHGGVGTPTKVVFKSSEAAVKGLGILNEIKRTKKLRKQE